jgi:predicted nucleic acid-binding protein
MIAADTGPLVALAKINQLPLLAELFGDIYVPPAVRRELLAKIGREAIYLDEAFSRIITSCTITGDASGG